LVSPFKESPRLKAGECQKQDLRGEAIRGYWALGIGHWALVNFSCFIPHAQRKPLIFRYSCVSPNKDKTPNETLN
ncbi:MAG: hypothetical protein ACIWVG_04615, partial [Gloeotrichia echinulata HAB0833]